MVAPKGNSIGEIVIEQDLFLEKLHEILANYPTKRAIKKIEEILKERFPEERLEFPVTGFNQSEIRAGGTYIKTNSLRNGFISLFNQVQKKQNFSDRQKELILKFCGVFLKNTENVFFDDREITMLDQWFKSSRAHGIFIGEEKGMGLVSISQWSERKGLLPSNLYWHNYYLPKNWTKKDAFSHILTVGRLPVLKEARKYNIVNER